MTLALRYSRRAAGIAAAALACAALAACGPKLASVPLPIGTIEELYREARALRDQIDLARGRGVAVTTAGAPLAEAAARYAVARGDLSRALAAGAAPPLSAEDERALAVMRRSLDGELGPAAAAGAESEADAEVDCGYDPELVASGSDGFAALSRRLYACFSQAAHSLSFEGEPIDRLTIFGRVAVTGDPQRREALWRSLAPVWRAVNGDGGARSPYRTLVRRNAARLREAREELGAGVRRIGVDPAGMEQWLALVLERWRAIAPEEPIEPWDFAYLAGRASRALERRIPRERLREINDRFYRDLGADPDALQVRYDLEPRASKDPVAFTTFGRRPRLRGDRVLLGQPWVVASYRIGGLDNLAELLHETGHAVHIAAIRARPAFTDWPDSDIFTEGIADAAALELYEPAWQRRYLGASVPIEVATRAKYAGIAMDVAWALFEIRLHREPGRDPNELWAEITRRYLGVAPHPELSWWAVRGQLVDAPGYLLNYAAGAILVADLRARLRELYGSYAEGDPGWYARVSQSLYRFGLARPSAEVIEEFLGRPVSPQALLDDMARAARPDPAAPRPSR